MELVVHALIGSRVILENSIPLQSLEAMSDFVTGQRRGTLVEDPRNRGVGEMPSSLSRPNYAGLINSIHRGVQGPRGDAHMHMDHMS